MDFGTVYRFAHVYGDVASSSLGAPASPDYSPHDSPVDRRLCAGCSDVISDRYLCVVGDEPWHVTCLRCIVCDVSLHADNSCYVRNGSVYCRRDYVREFGTKCTTCHKLISSDDWVRYAHDNVYHMACFACSICGRQLSTGDEFTLKSDLPLCRRHSVLEQTFTIDSLLNEEKKPRKRIRSSFTEEQLQILQRHFEKDTNPDCHDMEKLAMLTGHNRRVIQVWFQNTRARTKKQGQKQGTKKYVRSATATRKDNSGARNWGSGSDSPDSNAMSD